MLQDRVRDGSEWTRATGETSDVARDGGDYPAPEHADQHKAAILRGKSVWLKVLSFNTPKGVVN